MPHFAYGYCANGYQQQGRYCHAKIYSNNSLVLSADGLGLCVSVRQERHKLHLYPYQNIVCRKFGSGIDHYSIVCIIRFATHSLGNTNGNTHILRCCY